MKKLGLTLITMMMASGAVAQTIELGIPTYSGTGCPEGTIDAVVSPDGGSLSIIFDQFVVEAGGSKDAEQRARKSCKLTVPAKPPKGFKIHYLQVDYRGFAEIGKDGIASFTAEHKFMNAGRVRPVRTVERFKEGHSGDFLISHPLSYFVTPCGASMDMEFDTSLMVNAYKMVGRGRVPTDEVSMVGLDSSDISNEAPITIKYGLKPCN